MKAGLFQTEIAKVIGVHKSTISREMRCNRGHRGHRPKQAQCFAMKKWEQAVSISSDRTLVEHLLREYWSPEQISGWLSCESQMTVSHESIYQFILKDKLQGGNLYLHFRCKKQRRKRYGSTNYRGRILNRILIDQRPAIVDERLRVGDWV